MISGEQKKKIDNLLSQMTLQEKIGQLNQVTPSIVGSFDVSFEELINMVEDGRISKEEFGAYMSSSSRDFHEDKIRKGLIGSILLDDPEKANELQRIAVEESRLGIPLIFGYDVIHGLKSVYPIPLAEACSFDEDIFEKTAAMAAADAKGHGITWTFGPMLDVARDARWGRVSEGPGEDPYLTSVYARNTVRGFQNNGTCNVAACMKHFAGYSACEGGRDYNTVSIAVSKLYNVFLPPFRAAAEEDAVTAMAAFNDLNGVPCTVNKPLLNDILRGELGFHGFIVSDANAIKECVSHGIAATEKEAGRMAMDAGVDMDMSSNIYIANMEKLIEEGNISSDQLDEAVRRILTVKMWLGLFDQPYIPQDLIEEHRSISASDRELAYKAAVESIVLLKNEQNILPLKKDARISVIGSLAEKKEEALGAWAMSGNPADCVSILEGMQAKCGNIKYFPCTGPQEDLNYEELERACEYGDVIVAVVGEPASMSGEAASKAVLEISENQKRMLQMVLDRGKKTVAVFMNGRPLAIGWEAETLPAIVESWHLGIEMGNAVASILFGDENPSGKLSVTMPAVTGTCPVYYNHENTGRPASKSKYTSKYSDAPLTPAFPFGYGLSYTEFEYKDVQVSEEENEIKVTVTVKNTGSTGGTEIVQLYVQDVTASIVRPVKELKGFRRVCLDSEEETQVTMSIRKNELGFYNNDGNYIMEDGVFNIYVGCNSADCICTPIQISF